MENFGIYQDIARRTEGDIYIGVVGPVRTGKSTFIKRFMELLVLPNIENEYKKERAVDELPQSASGRTIMTTEPKFIPNEAVEINLNGNVKLKTRLVDCVGYLVNNAIGYLENDMPRMVKTPWSENEIPFETAAELGTRKVIVEHSTVGIIITTDGSITDIPREDYIKAEERVVNELKELNKPFIILMNCQNPYDNYSIEMAERLSDKYSATVIPVNCLELNLDDIRQLNKAIDMTVSISNPTEETNIRVELYKRNPTYTSVNDGSTYTGMSYTLVDIKDYLKGTWEKPETYGLTSEVGSKEYMIQPPKTYETPVELEMMEFEKAVVENISSGEYKLVFKAYSENTLVQTFKKTFIVTP